MDVSRYVKISEFKVTKDVFYGTTKFSKIMLYQLRRFSLRYLLLDDYFYLFKYDQPNLSLVDVGGGYIYSFIR